MKLNRLLITTFAMAPAILNAAPLPARMEPAAALSSTLPIDFVTQRPSPVTIYTQPRKRGEDAVDLPRRRSFAPFWDLNWPKIKSFNFFAAKPQPLSKDGLSLDWWVSTKGSHLEGHGFKQKSYASSWRPMWLQ